VAALLVLGGLLLGAPMSAQADATTYKLPDTSPVSVDAACTAPSTPSANSWNSDQAPPGATTDLASCAGTSSTAMTIKLDGFDFSSIPSGSQIDGIEVHVNDISTPTSQSGTQKWAIALSWDGGTSVTAENTAAPDITTTALDGIEQYFTDTTSAPASTDQGSATTWGRTWSTSELSSTNFVVRITHSNSSTSSRTARFDIVEVKIFYTPPVTISGNAYTDESTTVWSGCPGTNVIALSVNGGAKTSANCDAAGFFTFSQLLTGANQVLTLFLDTAGGDKGVLYTKNNDTTTNITGLTLRKNRVWIQSESTQSITNANINTYDKTQDTDIPAASDGTALTVDAGVEVHVNTGDTFAPGGNVTAPNLHVKGTYSGVAETLTLNGSGTGACTTEPGTIRPLCIDAGTFTDPSVTKFSGTSASSIEATTYTTLQLQPSGAGNPTYTLLGGTLTTDSDLVIGDSTNAVTVDWETNDPAITVKGNLTLNSPSTWTKSSTATLTLSPTGTKTWTDSNGTKQDVGTVSISGGASTPVINLGSSAKATSVTIAAAHGLSANGANTLTLTGTGTPLSNSGTFTYSTGTVEYVGNGATVTALSGTGGANGYYNLSLKPGGASAQVFGAGTFAVNNDLVVGNGTNAGATAATNNPAITVTGNATIAANATFTSTSGTLTITGNYSNSGTFTHNAGTVTFNAGDAGNTLGGTMTGTSKFNNLTFNNAAGAWSFGAAAGEVANDLTITAGTVTAPSTTLTVTGNYSNSGTFTHNSGTVTFNAGDAGNTLGGTMTGTSKFNNLTFNNAAGAWSFGAAAGEVANDLTITAGTVTAPSTTLTVTGNYSNSGTFAHNNGLVLFNAGDTGNTLGGTMTGTSKFYDLTFNNAAGAWSFGAAAGEVANDFTITNTETVGNGLTAPSTTLTIGGNFTKVAGKFTHNSGTVELNDSAKISTLTYDAAITFSGLTVSTGSKEVRFDNVWQTNVAGALTINGGSCGTPVLLRSDSAGNQFELNATGGKSVNYADIQDSNAIAAITANDSKSNGNNTNWTITSGACTVSELRGGLELRGGTRIGL
jgi:hypothetical protein